MLGKRGQLTIFIIIALVFVFGIGTFFLLQSSEDDVSFEDRSFDGQVEVIREDMISCFEELSKETLETVGLQGGYYFEPLDYYVTLYDSNIPFYYFGDYELALDNLFIVDELIYGIDSQREKCLFSLEEYNLTYDFVYGLPNVSIESDEVVFTYNLVISVTRDDVVKQIDLESYDIRIDSHLADLRDTASTIAFSYDLNNASLCIDCIDEIGREKDYSIIIDDSIDDILILSIIDNAEFHYPSRFEFAMTAIPEELPFTASRLDSDGDIVYTSEEINISAPVGGEDEI